MSSRTRAAMAFRAQFAIVFMACTALEASALPITDLYNTGVAATSPSTSAATLPLANTQDPNYIILPFSAGGVGIPVTVDDSMFPFPAWEANVYGAGGSRWIGRTQNGDGSVGPYAYRTTFTLPANAALSTVAIVGRWASDNLGTDIVINGASTGQTNTGFLNFSPFSINGSSYPVQHGINTLDFYFSNSESVTGLRVDRLRGVYEIPEPNTFLITATSILGIALRRERA